MKKLIALLTVVGFMTFGASNLVLAQEQEGNEPQTEQVAEPQEEPVVEQTVAPAQAATEEVVAQNPEEVENPTFTEVLKKQFIDGGWQWMSVILLILVLGLAVSIERIIYLTLSTTNTKNLLANFEKALNEGGVEKAKDVCRDTKGPVEVYSIKVFSVTTTVSPKLRSHLHLTVLSWLATSKAVPAGLPCSSPSDL